MCYAICCDLVVPGLPSMRVTVPCELMSVNVALVSLLTCKRSRVVVYNMEYFYIYHNYYTPDITI